MIRASNHETLPRGRACSHGLVSDGATIVLPHYSQRELGAPVSQWKIVQRFDTATACEGYLQEMKDDSGALHAEYSVGPKF